MLFSTHSTKNSCQIIAIFAEHHPSLVLSTQCRFIKAELQFEHRKTDQLFRKLSDIMTRQGAAF